MRKTLITLGITLVSIQLTAQLSPEFEKYQPLYPKEHGVFLKKQVEVNIEVSKEGKLEIGEDHFESRLFLNDNAGYFIEDDIGYTSFSEINDIEPTVYLPAGQKFKKKKIENIKEVEEFQNNIFYDDYKKKVFYYDGLCKGAKTELSYNRQLKEPRFFGSFYFASYLPMESAVYTVTAPEHLQLTYRLFGKDKDKVKYTTTKKGGNVIHRWEAEKIDKLFAESQSVSLKNYATHMMIYVNEYEHKGEKITVTKGVDDLYSFYYDFVKDVSQTPSDELKVISDSITKNLTTDEEKVKAIFYWVQDNIRYVAIENGLGGFVPRQPSLVCSRRYGDCKDMSSITRELLSLAGIESSLTWIGTRDIPYSYNELPTTSVDNHMICAYHNGEDFVFLDATGSRLPYGMPTPFIQGKEALIGISETEYELIKVPEIPKERNTTRDSVVVTLEGDMLKGQGQVVYTGYPAMYVGGYMQSLSNEEKENFVKKTFKKGNNKCNSVSKGIENLNDRDAPLKIAYEFEVADYIKHNGDELYINPFLKQYNKSDNIDTETTKLDRENVYREINTNRVVINIPEGYEVTYVPENAEYDHDKFGFKIQFDHRKESRQIVLDYDFSMDHLVLSTEDFESWNEMIKKLNWSYSELIVLKKT